jgi:tetratricopeptide (TPR) repeat protein
MKTIDLNYFLERYISEEMDQAEKIWFEKELDGNADLRKELALRRRTDSVLRDIDILDLRAKLNAIEKERSEESSWTAARRRMLRYAAVAALFVITGTSIWLPNRRLSSDELFQRYYDQSSTIVNTTTRSAGSSFDLTYRAALKAYNDGQFELAVRYFEDFTTSNKETDIETLMGIEMMKGNSLIENESFTEAGRSYQKVVENNDNLYLEDATWLLGLCYLKTEDSEKAIEVMTKVADSASRHHKNARAILRRLK